jgi:hypothetical protein
VSDKPLRRVSAEEFMQRLRQVRIKFFETPERETKSTASVEYQKHENDWEEPGRTRQLALDQTVTYGYLRGAEDSELARHVLVRQFERLLWEVEKEMRQEQVDISQVFQSFATFEHERNKKAGR